MIEAYRYRAARADGTIEAGFLELGDRPEAIAALRARGLFPIEVTRTTGSGSRRSAIPAADLAIGLRTLATLLDSGLPLSRALAAFQDVVPRTWSDGVGVLREHVRQGAGLGAALELSVPGLPRELTSVIRSGEGGSGLAQSVRRAAELAESREALRASIMAALAYPVLLAIVGAASIAVIVLVVLPRFASIIADIGGDVPPLARGVMAGAHALKIAFLPSLGMIAVAVAYWRARGSDPSTRLVVDRALIALPVVGALRLCSASSRGCAALSALLESGVPVSTALVHAARGTADLEAERRWLAARENIIAGARQSISLVEAGAVTSTAGRLIRAGEESGQLPQMLSRAAALDAMRLADTLKGAVRLIEPAMIVAFAAIIALVSGALLQTVYAVKP